jgi:hypothetical protein
MSDRTLTGIRRLTQDIPEYQGSYTANFPDYKGWTNAGLPNALIYETYFDMSGLTLDDLTFVPQGSELQDPGRYIYDIPAIDTYPVVDVEVLDIISQERLTLADIDANLTLGNAPGMMETTEDFTQLIMGNYRVMIVSNTTANVELLLPVDGGLFSSAEATAAARLWCYRVVRINGVKGTGDLLKIPASRFILVGTTIEEKELPYMMRLKRSYELGTQG